jgi:hypothetical protein
MDAGVDVKMEKKVPGIKAELRQETLGAGSVGQNTHNPSAPVSSLCEQDGIDDDQVQEGKRALIDPESPATGTYPSAFPQTLPQLTPPPGRVLAKLRQNTRGAAALDTNKRKAARPVSPHRAKIVTAFPLLCEAQMGDPVHEVGRMLSALANGP